MFEKDQNNSLSAVDRKSEHFEAINSKDFIINIDSMAIISYEREEKFRTKKPRTTEGPRTRDGILYLIVHSPASCERYARVAHDARAACFARIELWNRATELDQLQLRGTWFDSQRLLVLLE